jgi:hypothetical protein
LAGGLVVVVDEMAGGRLATGEMAGGRLATGEVAMGEMAGGWLAMGEVVMGGRVSPSWLMDELVPLVIDPVVALVPVRSFLPVNFLYELLIRLRADLVLLNFKVGFFETGGPGWAVETAYKASSEESRPSWITS